ncbi:poly polymerase 2-A [Sodiomyces alkalinus F11]|uniref:Poly [ADP-ribose] polymerase n=1 Tax=Sodiomyces alkalinus (strain CBS 110278 / VKM F-3762 / F11) TaxID=1314773 RepID=A0A3N2PX52_SODAK|nr:poly polymerase 2-A [Sodiomyces alkalinus F11]ROT39067.1 poly polymerase 2-A [Sodiomyces alkalinus F11]
MTNALRGCVIALGGSFAWDVAAYVSTLGADFNLRFSKKTTHVITTDKDVTKNAKVRQARARGGCHIISVEWAQESGRLGCKADEAKFAFDDKSTSNGSVPARAGGRTTRSAAAQSVAAQPASASVVQDAGNDTGFPIRKSTKRSAPDADETDAQNGNKDDTVSQSSKKSKVTKSEEEEKDKKEEEEKVKQGEVKEKEEVSEGQIAKSKDVVIPLDEGVTLANAKVYIDPSGVIYDAALNQTNAGRNNNKFYRVQLLQSGSTYMTWTRWGRVGEYGQTAILGQGTLDDALSQFNKKFKDKSGHRWEDRAKDPKPNKYAFVEKNYNPDSDSESESGAPDVNMKDIDADEEPGPEPECKLDPAVQDLLALIFNQQYFAAAMSEFNYDANKMPLGKLSKATITKGFQALKDLSELFDNQTLAQSIYSTDYGSATEMLSNRFYSLIPHDFGRRRPPIIRTEALLKKEVELLESLSDMKDAAEIMKLDRVKAAGRDNVHPMERQFLGLGLDEMTVLNPKSNEFDQLSRYLMETKGSTHYVNYSKVEQIFRIDRAGERSRFEKYKDEMGQTPGLVAKTERRLLWHGSRATNFGGILSQGLRIAPPEAPSTGYMFGKGIYLADMSSKSVNYCVPSLSGNTALLLLCEAELGDPMQELVHASYSAGEEAQRKGLVATWGQGRTGPTAWKDAGCVHPSLKGVKMPDVSVKPGDSGIASAGLLYNEYIVYNTSQVHLRYLLRVKLG